MPLESIVPRIAIQRLLAKLAGTDCGVGFPSFVASRGPAAAGRAVPPEPGLAMGNGPASQGATRTCWQAGAIVAYGPREHARHSCARLTCHASRRLTACGAARCERIPLEPFRHGRQLRQRPRTAAARAACPRGARLGSIPGISVCRPPRQRVCEDEAMRVPSATGRPVSCSCRHSRGRVAPGRHGRPPGARYSRVAGMRASGRGFLGAHRAVAGAGQARVRARCRRVTWTGYTAQGRSVAVADACAPARPTAGLPLRTAQSVLTLGARTGAEADATRLPTDTSQQALNARYQPVPSRSVVQAMSAVRSAPTPASGSRMT
jgi:hypothetical protein